MRRVEAFAGEYASGKSEVAINRAINIHEQQRTAVTLADLDLVEPFATLGPLKEKLEERGLRVVARSKEESFGAGEAGVVLTPAAANVLRCRGDVVLDLGYGPGGDRLLNLIHGAGDEPQLKIYLVVNITRPMTAVPKDIYDFGVSFGRVDGLINNSHLGEETTLDIIKQGLETVELAAKLLKVSVIATAALKKFRPWLGNKDWHGHSVWYLERFLADPVWN